MMQDRPLATLRRALAALCQVVVLSLAMAPRTAHTQELAEYRLGPEDVVQVQVLNRPDLSGPRTVGIDGKMLDPYVKEVDAAGRTEAEVAAELTRHYQVSFGVSQVFVSVLQYNSRKITVTGEVRKQGTFGFRDIPDLWEVIGKHALGLTPLADAARVKIIHKDPVEGEPQVVTVDLSPVLNGAVSATLPPLRAGDMVDVPSLVAEGAAPSGARIQVLGFVRVPGLYSLHQAETLAEALAIAGGPLPEANLRKVQLTRATPEGTVAYRLDLEALLFEGKTVADFKLHEGDTVTFPAKKFGAGTFGRAMVYFLPLVTSLVSLVVILDDSR